MNKFRIFVGVTALLTLFSFNLMHALSDYGVSNLNNILHPQVYAQTNSAGGGGTTPSCNCAYWPGPTCSCGHLFSCHLTCGIGGGGTPGGGTPGDGGGSPCVDRTERAWCVISRREVLLVHLCNRAHGFWDINPCRQETPNSVCTISVPI